MTFWHSTFYVLASGAVAVVSPRFDRLTYRLIATVLIAAAGMVVWILVGVGVDLVRSW